MRRSLTFPVLLVGLLSCSKDATGPKPPSPPIVRVVPESAVVDLFDTLRLRAIVLDSAGDTLNLLPVWTSADANKVFVNSLGRVEGLNRATVQITATVGDGVGHASIRVKINVITVQLAPGNKTLAIGDTLREHPTLFTADGLLPDDSTPTWSSSDTSIAVVSSSGLITARHQGTAIVGSKVDTAVGHATITVPAPAPVVASVTITPGDTTILASDLVTFAAIARDSQGDTLGQLQELCIPLCHVLYPVSFSLSDSTIAHFTDCCAISFPTAGVDTLVATSKNVSGRAVIHIAFLGLKGVEVGSQACGIAVDSIPYCWTGGHPTHVSTTLRQFVSVSTDNGTCGLTTSGAAYCFGDSAVAVDGGKTYTALDVGGSFVCGIDNSAAAWCWGTGGSGQLGDSSNADSPTPVAVSGGHTFTAISTGSDHACSIATGGAAFCWGSNGGGMLGGGDTITLSTVPAAVTGGLSFTAISAGVGYSCGVASTGDAYCWGFNSDGELGTGDSVSSNVPRLVTGGLHFKSISAGLFHTCALTTTGAAYCWGGDGVLGTGIFQVSATPVAVSGGLVFQTISVSSDLLGGSGTCGLTAGGVYCWGSFSGEDANPNSAVPVKVQGQQ
jgi:hypothetical protein